MGRIVKNQLSWDLRLGLVDSKSVAPKSSLELWWGRGRGVDRVFSLLI